MNANATLRYQGEKRAKRMPEADALRNLAANDYVRGDVIRHTIHKNNRETIVTEYYRAGVGTARLTATFTI